MDAAIVYTRSMFERFSKELFKSGSFACGDSNVDGVYRVVLLPGFPNVDNGLIEYKVAVSDGGDNYHCDCKLFEHTGIPCRHILRVSVKRCRYVSIIEL